MDLEEMVQTALVAGTKEKARALVDAETARICAAETGRRPAEVKKILLSNIGYMAGYKDQTTADRIYELFDTEHPFFGRRHPTAEEAFVRGRLWGYLTLNKPGMAKQLEANAFVESEDWAGLMNWIDRECGNSEQQTVL